MVRATRAIVAVVFWIVHLWWVGHVVQALRYAPGGTFRVYSVVNNDIVHTAWGLTFSGEQGRALAIAWLALVAYATIGSIIARGTMWLFAAIVLLAWAMLFAGNSLWLSQWQRFAWWDWVNFAGVAIVAAHIACNWRQHLGPNGAERLRVSGDDR